MVDTTKLRALLDAAQVPGPAVVREAETWAYGGYALVAVVVFSGDIPLAACGNPDLPRSRNVGDLIAAAVDALPWLLDEVERLKAAERRAEEAEAQVEAARSVVREIRDTCCAVLGDGFETIPTTALVRIIRDRLRAAENERDSLRAEVERLKARIDAVGRVLAESGCDCDCGCFWDEHGDGCDRCLACRVEDAIARREDVVVEGEK